MRPRVLSHIQKIILIITVKRLTLGLEEVWLRAARHIVPAVSNGDDWRGEKIMKSVFMKAREIFMLATKILLKTLLKYCV